mmetsp:Transcript_9120/g.18884  ORF Transcript_9120/g.18884 Transcript_9120/m.18884 type:complete len:294 (+) Transcript_9120:342-1223(+)
MGLFTKLLKTESGGASALFSICGAASTPRATCGLTACLITRFQRRIGRLWATTTIAKKVLQGRGTGKTTIAGTMCSIDGRLSYGRGVQWLSPRATRVCSTLSGLQISSAHSDRRPNNCIDHFRTLNTSDALCGGIYVTALVTSRQLGSHRAVTFGHSEQLPAFWPQRHQSLDARLPLVFPDTPRYRATSLRWSWGGFNETSPTYWPRHALSKSACVIEHNLYKSVIGRRGAALLGPRVGHCWHGWRRTPAVGSDMPVPWAAEIGSGGDKSGLVPRGSALTGMVRAVKAAYLGA